MRYSLVRSGGTLGGGWWLDDPDTNKSKNAKNVKNAKIVRYEDKDVANLGNPIPIAISAGHMSMLLNGAPYGDDIQPRERIPVDTVQLIDIFHETGGGHKGGMGHGMMGRGMMGQGGMMGRGMMGPGPGPSLCRRYPRPARARLARRSTFRYLTSTFRSTPRGRPSRGPAV